MIQFVSISKQYNLHRQRERHQGSGGMGRGAGKRRMNVASSGLLRTVHTQRVSELHPTLTVPYDMMLQSPDDKHERLLPRY